MRAGKPNFIQHFESLQNRESLELVLGTNNLEPIFSLLFLRHNIHTLSNLKNICFDLSKFQEEIPASVLQDMEFILTHVSTLENVFITFPEKLADVQPTAYITLLKSLQKIEKLDKLKLIVPSLRNENLVFVISDHLGKLCGLKECNLSLGEWGHIVQVCYLLQSLAKPNNLRILCLSIGRLECKNIGWTFFCDAFAQLTSLTFLELDLSTLEFNKFFLEKLISSLKRLDKLETLFMILGGFSKVSDKVLAEFGEQLASIQNIKKLTLGMKIRPIDRISREGVEEFKESLLAHPNWAGKSIDNLNLRINILGELPTREELAQKETEVEEYDYI